MNHEIKFGGRTREATTETAWSYPGRNIYPLRQVTYAGVAGDMRPWVHRLRASGPGRADDYASGLRLSAIRLLVPVMANYDSLWVQDTMTMGAWTFNAGFRYDDQSGSNKGGTVEANHRLPQR